MTDEASKDPAKRATDYEADFLAGIEALSREGIKGLGPFLAKYRTDALARALEGDPTELADLVRGGWAINDDERKFLADVVQGIVEPKTGRPPKTDLSRRIALAHYWLTKHDGLPVEAAVHQLMRIHGIERASVFRHLKKANLDQLTQRWIATYEHIRSNEGLQFLIPEARARDLLSK